MPAATSDRADHRRYSVHPMAEARSHAHLIDGASFEDAALHFLEEHHPPADADDEVSLIIEDCETGHRQCFRIDLTTGQTAPCD